MKTNKYYIFSLILVALTIFSGNAWSADKYALVTDAGTLAANDQIIIVYSDGSSTHKALSTTQNKNNRAATDVTIGNDGKIEPGNAVQIITLGTATKGDNTYWTLIVGNNSWLYAAGSSSNYLRTEATLDNEGKWAISIANDEATVLAQGTNRPLMRYNPNNGTPIFSCYDNVASPNGSPIKIYKKEVASSIETPEFLPAGGIYTSAQSVTITCSTVGTTIYYTTDNSTPTSTSTQYTGAISVGSSQTIKAIAIKGAASSNVGAATYTINIPATVSFSTGENNPGVDPETEENKGDGITLPAGPTPACSAAGWVFAGWATAEVSNVTVAPRLYMPGSEYVPDGNETLYAVYRKLTGGTSTATFTSTDLSNLTLISGSLTSNAKWIHKDTGIEFYIKSYGIYSNQFDIWKSWALIDAHTKIQQVEFTISGSDKINSVALNDAEAAAGGSAELTNTTSPQTITCSGDVSQLILNSPSNGDSYFTSFTVTYYNTKFESNPSCEPCTATPSVGAASLEGDFSLSSVGVKCASAAASPNDDDCGLTEYGFVWGTSNEDGHPNKNDNVLTNTGEYAANYTNTITNVSADVTYYYRGYAKNNGDNYGYSSAIQSFTPRTVNYNKNANDATGSNPAQQVVNTGGTVTLPAANAYSWTGHTLVKWAAGSAEGTQYNPSATSPAIDESTTFYAIWETNKHKFAWNFNGGSSTETAGTDYTAANDEKLFGTEITYPTNESMERTGYTFGSWSSSATTMPDADLTITANWNTVNYTITYNTNGGAAIAVGNYNIETATFSLPTPSKDGYTFAGWKTNSGLTGESVSSIAVGTTGNKEYWAAWTANTYEVVFHKNGGQGDNMSNQSFTYDEAKKALSANTYTPAEGSHKYFNGWATSISRANAGTVDYEDKAEVQNLTKTANGTFNLYAVWVAYNYKNYRTTCCTKYDITAETPENGSFTVKDGDDEADKACATTTITIAATPASDSYVFNHWSIVDGESNDITEDLLGENPPASTSFEMPAKAITINAVFNLKTTEYAVTLHDNNGGEHNGSATVSTNGTVLSNISLPTKEGYHVAGYYLEAGCETLVANAAGTLQPNVDGITDENAQFIKGEAITLYAAWEGNQYTVTLAKNYGSAGSSNVTATFGQNMPNMGDKPGRAGYEFTGYYANNDGTGTKYYNADKSSAHVWDQAEDKTIYAAWSPKNYTITLNNEGADDGKGGTASIAVTFDSNENLSGTPAITRPEKAGYKFCGYYTSANGEGSQIIDENGDVKASVSGYTSDTKQWRKAGSDEVNLYAFWKACHTVTWSVNGEETPEVVVHGEKVAAMPDPAPTSSDCDDAKKFVGWRAEKITGTSATNPGSIFTTVEGSPEVTDDVTFYAVFADVTGGDAIELTFPDDNKANNEVQDYTSTWTAKAGTYDFTITNFNNSRWGYGWNHIRCGQKSYTSVASISTADAVPFAVDSVLIEIEDIDESFINSAKLYISANSNFSSATDMDIPQSEATQKMVIASAAKNKYYKIEFDCKAKSNGFVQINSVVYKQKIDTSNYVTTCASCDADATFTTALPAISAEDCTSATVTATGGLATLGSEGCNISDYGFVLGTATDPEIDGDGVTKLQVGTSNPTTGEDFSQNLTSLTAATHYYVRAYAINRHGTAYSSTKDFWTNGVSSIVVTHAPSKTNYIVGETFDATGMEVTATLAGGATDDVTADVTYSSSTLTAGASQNFAINYSLCGTEVGVNQTINVYTLTVTEGDNPSYGTASNTSANIVSVTGLGDHKTYTLTVTSGNATAVDNGDNTWSITNPSGDVTVRVDYKDAAQVDVYYKVNGETVLTQKVWESETTTLPNAADVTTALGEAASKYPNFAGWSETEFAYQATEPTLVSGAPTINAEKTFYAVFTNVNKVRIDGSVITSNGYPSNEANLSVNNINFKYHNILRGGNSTDGYYLQLRWNSTPYGYIYNSDEIVNITRIVSANYRISVYACTMAGTTTGSAITAEAREETDPYVYMLPANTSYFKLATEKDVQCKTDYIDIYYAPEAIYYTTQFQTLTFNKLNEATEDKSEIVAKNKAYTLTANNAPTEVEHYTFLDKWKDSQNTYKIGDAVTMSTNVTLTPISAYETTGDTDIDGLPESVTEIVVNVSKELNVNDNRTINTLTIKSTSGAYDVAGTSGQVTGEKTLTVSDNLFLEIKLCNGDMNAEASRKWYCISAPFEVDINGGFFWGDGTPMVLNTHFQLFEWDGDRRATGASGWRRTSSNMKAHTAYFIGFDDERVEGCATCDVLNQNTIKLKALNNTISNVAKINAPTHGTNDDDYANWNGLANPNFYHVALDKDVHAFNYNKQTYATYDAGDYNFVVGTPFFLNETGDITISEANNTKPYRAPKREGENYKFRVRIGKSGAEIADNHVYVRASETASASYEKGHDVITMNGTTASSALIWTENYGGKRLAIEEAPLINGTASYVLTLSAPANGTYSISVAAPQDNADLYLTYDGTIIWNLSESAYTVDLNKGITNGYGLVLRAKAPSVVTGIDQINAKAGAQKVIIDEHVYILRGGQMYDVNGKMVK